VLRSLPLGITCWNRRTYQQRAFQLTCHPDP
jgi:hypothetical protein